jgi:hypothetical protein
MERSRYGAEMESEAYKERGRKREGGSARARERKMKRDRDAQKNSENIERRGKRERMKEKQERERLLRFSASVCVIIRHATKYGSRVTYIKSSRFLVILTGALSCCHYRHFELITVLVLAGCGFSIPDNLIEKNIRLK